MHDFSDIHICSMVVNILKPVWHSQSFLCQRKLAQSLWSVFDSVKRQRKFWPKIWTNFDGVELHPTFLQSFISFDGNQPIRIQFRIYIICVSQQKHMFKKVEKAPDPG